MRARPPAAWVSVLYCQGTCSGVGSTRAAFKKNNIVDVENKDKNKFHKKSGAEPLFGLLNILN